jgi:cytochrome c5
MHPDKGNNKDSLRRALGRLGRVSPEVLDSSRERVRKNLNAERRPVQLPLPDSTPTDLTSLRRPLYLAAAIASVCALVLVGAIVKWKPETRITRKQIAQSQPSPPPSPLPTTPVVEPPPAPTPTPPKSNKSPKPLPVQRPRPQVPFALLPPGEGKVILDRACGTCHRAAAVGASHYATRAEYADVVTRMIAKGAQVSDQEADTLTGYLYDNLKANSGQQATIAGRALLDRVCTTCHSLNGISDYSYDSEAPYKELVETMVSYGAALTDVEKKTLIRYLFTTYGKR